MGAARVLYAPRNISGQASEYAVAVAAFGYEGEVWSYGEPAFGFTADRVIDPVRLRTDPEHRWAVLSAAVTGFDAFHLQYGRSLLDPIEPGLPALWDLPLLKSLGKKVFMHFRGSDVRLRSVHLELEPDSYFRDADVACDEDAIRAKVAICRRYCDELLVSTPGLLDHVADAHWIPHVIDVDGWPYVERVETDTPTVVHIPSNRGIKGSDHVQAALGPLVDDGVCRYREIGGVGRDELARTLREADIVVDSLTIGDHGLLSVEAMASGAIAIAHIRETNRARNPGVPVVEATPATLGEVVAGLAADPRRRAEVRRAGRAWVEERHSRRAVGRLLADFYDRPAREVDLSHPDWPRPASQRHVEHLELEVERLRAAGHPLADVVRPYASGLVRGPVPQFAVQRLARRIDELEEELRPQRSLGLRERAVAWIRRHPRLHRTARRLRRALDRR